MARQQVEGGAQIIDINMDEGLLDSKAAMQKFHCVCWRQSPDIARDADYGGQFQVGGHRRPPQHSRERHRQFHQPERGEAKFLEQDRSSVGTARRWSSWRLTSVARRIRCPDARDLRTSSYRLLTTQVGVPPQDIIFDPNIPQWQPGWEEHNNYAVDFIEATRWIKQHLPLAKVSGGSVIFRFSFRGNNVVREVCDAAFLYHAIQAGLDMGIVNAGQLAV